jgi:hypothetical protein
MDIIFNLFIAMMATSTSFQPEIVSAPTTIKWPENAPRIKLVIQNKTTNRIEARHDDKSIGYIDSSGEATVPIFNSDATIDRKGREWEVSELYKFFGPGSRRISLNPSLFVSNNILLINYPHYLSLRRSSISSGEILDPHKKYCLVFIIRGNRFEKSTIEIKEDN